MDIFGTNLKFAQSQYLLLLEIRESEKKINKKTAVSINFVMSGLLKK